MESIRQAPSVGRGYGWITAIAAVRMNTKVRWNINFERCDNGIAESEDQMQDVNVRKKPPVSALAPSSQKLLVGRKEAADLLSISARAVDYLVANKQLSTRRIGARVLIPVADLQRFVRADHPDRLAG